MARKELGVIERQVATPNVSIGSSNNALNRMGEATQGLGNLLAGALSDQAVYQSALAGEEAAAQGKAPKKLMMPLNKATAAYNKAVIETEARQLVTEGTSLLSQAYVNASNPATFNAATPAQFDAQSQGIVEGILENTRPENRTMVAQNLAEVVIKAKAQMLGHAIEYDNKNTVDSFKRDQALAMAALDEAYQTGGPEAEAAAKKNIDDIYNNYATINESIRLMMPTLKKELDDRIKENRVIGEFLFASNQGKGEEFISNFATREQPGLTQAEKYAALNKLINLNNQIESAINYTRVVDKQEIINNIDNPLGISGITSLDQLESSVKYQTLTPLQQAQVIGHFIHVQNSKSTDQAKINEALKEISNGRAGAVEKSTIDKMFLQVRNEMEQSNGRTLNLVEQFEIVKSLQTNVSNFDKLVSNKLLSQDQASTLEAAQLYATAALQNQDNLIHISGDAAVVAQKLATQINSGSPPTPDFVKNTIDLVLKKTDARISERSTEVNKVWTKNGVGYYKDVFGKAPDAFSDNGAYKVFEDTFKNYYVSAATPEEASRLTRDAMREWGADPYFEDDVINQFPPSKELPMAASTYAVHNQIAIAFDDIAKNYNRNIKVNDKNETRKPMKFANNVTLPEKLNQVDMLEKPLGVEKLTLADLEIPLVESNSMMLPVWVEVDGVKSQLKLQSCPQTKASPNKGLVYGLMAQDKFGVYQQLRDDRNNDGLAYVVLQDLNQLVPQLYKKQGDERLIEAYKKAQIKQEEARIEKELRTELYGGETPPLLPQPANLIAKIGANIKARFMSTKDIPIDELNKAIAAGEKESFDEST